MKITRIYPFPAKSFFLFGPRGVGKSTWVKEFFKPAVEINLLSHQVFLQLQNNPSLLEAKLNPIKKNSWVFIDEIQKLPALLDVIHRLIETRKINFLLTGSSSRKIKREGGNLLGGRAREFHLYPLTSKELGLDCLLI